MLKVNEDDMDEMKDNFLHSLIKNMSDGMVEDVRKSKGSTVEPSMDRSEDIHHMDVGVDTDEGADRDEDEHEEEDEITSHMNRGRRMYPNSF